MINADEFETQWKDIRKHVRPRWQAITDAEVNRIDGHVDVLVDLLEEKYGYSRIVSRRRSESLPAGHARRPDQLGSMPLFDHENGHRDCDAAAADGFSDRALIIASNRGPITFDGTDDGDHPRFRRGAGGLVTALIGLAQHLDATWIACARTNADADWHEGLVNLPDSDRQLRVNFLSPETAIYERYYDVIANPLLWFLQHAMWDVSRAPVIDRATWQAWDEGYKVVNCLFAQAIVQRIRADPRPTLIMLQDYHLYLVARYVRDQMRLRPKHTLLHFIHIPWPGSTYWSLLPGTMRHSILDSLCAVDLLGFQTYDDALNFLRSCESYLPGAHINFRRQYGVVSQSCNARSRLSHLD